jgi:hypothetical protein
VMRYINNGRHAFARNDSFVRICRDSFAYWPNGLAPKWSLYQTHAAEQ